jgi:hypothetical protein
MGYRQRWTGVLFFCLGSISLAADTARAAALKLKWQDTSSSETGFKIERLNGSTYVEIASVAANVVTYSDANLNAGATYCYRVRAFNTAGASAPSNAACTTAPTTTVGTDTATAPSTSTGTTSPTTTPTTSPAPTSPAPAGAQWTDYLLSAKLRSTDNDELGLMFRYQDKNNYYRFSWSAEGKARRLEKRVGGVSQILAQDSAAYITGQTYAVRSARAVRH